MQRIVFLSLLFCAAAAAADIDQARKEGEVVWYTAMNVPDAEVVRKPFNERYPFVKLTLLRSTGEKVRTRILTEAQAGRHTWDVVSFNLLDIDALAREGLLAELPKTYFTPEAMSCSANAAPPVPSKTLNAWPSAACACATGISESRISFAEVAEIPAVAMPLRNVRREMDCERKRATSSLIAFSRTWRRGNRPSA